MNDLPTNLPRVINRKKLMTKLASIATEQNIRTHSGRCEMRAALSYSLNLGRNTIRDVFEKEANGLQCANLTALLTDQLLRTIYEVTTLHAYRATNPTESERLTVVALGGYGRTEMAPYSDIDLLFLRPYKLTAWAEQVIEFVLYMLWDLGLKVGQSVRSLDECLRMSRKDVTVCTAMLEARYICGDRSLFDLLQTRFSREVLAGTGSNFVELKLAERDMRHKRMGDSRYFLEPNVKEGKGGLRDLHTLFWIGKHLYKIRGLGDLVESGILTSSELLRFKKAESFFWTIRHWLHYLGDRAEDRLTFDLQLEISKKLGYRESTSASRVERFMKHYYLFAKEAGDLTRIFCATIEAKEKRQAVFSISKIGDFFRRDLGGFKLEGGRLSVTADNRFAEQPVDMIRLFAVAQSYQRDIHPHALALLTRNLSDVVKVRSSIEANHLFVQMLVSRQNPELTLRRMNEAGLLGRFIPQFGRIVGQTQHDRYHVYTVDEHTIRAIGILHQIESGDLAEDHPLATTLVHKIVSRRVLYLAVLLHDIAKGAGGDHSVIGKSIAESLCPRLGFDKNETALVAWLVRWHLAMSHTAFKRDLEDSKTITDFANFVGNEERLRLLLILTVADIRAVGPERWNGWKGQLLRTLYDATSSALAGTYDQSRQQRIIDARASLRAALSEWSDQEFIKFAERAYDSYWLSLDTDTQIRQAKLIASSLSDCSEPLVEAYVDQVHGVTELTVYFPDHPGLFSQLALAFSLSGASVVDARINTMSDGVALDTFWLQNADKLPFEGDFRIERLKKNINDLLGGIVPSKSDGAGHYKALSSRMNQGGMSTRVLVDNTASNVQTVIEVGTMDRAGLLYDLTSAIISLDLQVSSAHITTYGDRAVDVFYLKDMFGLKITHQGKIEEIKTVLYAAATQENSELAEIDAA